MLVKAKYIKREKKGGKWVYTYAEPKALKKEQSEKKESGAKNEFSGDSRKAKGFKEDATPLQKNIVRAMLNDEDFDSFTKDFSPVKEVRVFENISNKLGLFEGNYSLSKVYENKPFGEFKNAIKKKVKEIF